MKRMLSFTFFVAFFVFLSGSPSASQTVRAAGEAGSIAYIRGSSEIRVINPDGSGDHLVWKLPRPELAASMGISSVAWRPDGRELAFTSGHEATESLYLSDVYTIKPDGTGLQKISNPPDAAEFARSRKGSVTVTVQNGSGIMAAPSTSFLVYVEGAAEPQSVALPPGASRTLTFENVADLGPHPQPVVAMFGKSRWFIPGVDVVAGRNVRAGVLSIIGRGVENYGAYASAWMSGGSQLSYELGNCAGVFILPADPIAGSHQDKPLLGGRSSANVCTWDMGPTPATADKALIGGGLLDANVYLATIGSNSRGEKLVQTGPTDLLNNIQWLPDGSGFLVSVNTGGSADLYRYDFATKKTTRLTRLGDKFIRGFSVSPGGDRVVYELANSVNDQEPDLWTMDLSGKEQHLLVRNASSPSWGR